MNQADTAWMLISTALVLLMTPALGFFYGGLVRSKNALNTMMMSFIALGFVGVMWATIGYSLAFTRGNNWLGDASRIFLRGVGVEPQGTIPHYLSDGDGSARARQAKGAYCRLPRQGIQRHASSEDGDRDGRA